jgi:hypothetical protein
MCSRPTKEEKITIPWAIWEIELMKELIKYTRFGEHPFGIRHYFPTKEVEDIVHYRTILQQKGRPPEREETEDCIPYNRIADLPIGMNLIPLVPFAKVCSFLSAEQVFGILPLVCFHYYLMIRSYKFQIQSAKVDFGEWDCVKAVMLQRKVTSCKELSIERPSIFEANQYFSASCLKNLLSHFKSSLQVLHCSTSGSPEVEKFINNNSKVRSLQIRVPGCGMRGYSWDRLQINHNIKKFSYINGDLQPRTIEYILDTFPELRDLELIKDSFNPFPSYIAKPDEGPTTKLVRLRGDRILALSQMLNIEVLEITITTTYVLDRLIEMLPSLSKLHRLQIRLFCRIFNKPLEWPRNHSAEGKLLDWPSIEDSNHIFNRLLEGTRSCERLKELQFPFIICDPVTQIIKELMLMLPDSIRILSYNDVMIRNSNSAEELINLKGLE